MRKFLLNWVSGKNFLIVLLVIFCPGVSRADWSFLGGRPSAKAVIGVEPCESLSPAELLQSICGSIHDIDQLHDILNAFPALSDVPRRNCGIRHERYDVCSSCEEDIGPDQIDAIQEIFGDSQHRLHHADWHAIRTDYAAASSEQRRIWEARGELDFGGGDPMDHVMGGKLAGEDFLFMHREMIKMLQIQLSVRGLGCIAPWRSVPARADDPKFPVPQVYALRGRSADEWATAGDGFTELIRRTGKIDIQQSPVGTQRALAQQVLEAMQRIDRMLRDPAWLRSHSLNDLGNAIDDKVSVSLHSGLHGLYDSHDFCVPGSKVVAQNCHTMTDFSISPQNPYFWKIHGLIDEYLNLWLDANGYKEIARDCGNPARPGCYTWQGTWAGKMPFQPPSGGMKMN